jgi:hypothetical protein
MISFHLFSRVCPRHDDAKSKNNNSSIAAVKKIDSRFGTNTSRSSTFSERSHGMTAHEVKHNVNKRRSAFKHYHSNILEMQLFEPALNPVEHSLIKSQEQLKFF